MPALTEPAVVSIRSRDWVRMIMSFSALPGYQRQAELRLSKLWRFIPIIKGWPEVDHAMPRSQRHTANRLFERLQNQCGFLGADTIIKTHIRKG